MMQPLFTIKHKSSHKEYLSAGTYKAQIQKIFPDTISCICCAAAACLNGTRWC